MSVSGSVVSKDLRASARRPLSMYQRAVSGSRSKKGIRMMAGTAATPSMMRQLNALLTSDSRAATRKPMMIPMTQLTWYITSVAPRMRAGTDSATKTGTATSEMPMVKPRSTRAIHSEVTSQAAALSRQKAM